VYIFSQSANIPVNNLLKVNNQISAKVFAGGPRIHSPQHRQQLTDLATGPEFPLNVCSVLCRLCIADRSTEPSTAVLAKSDPRENTDWAKAPATVMTGIAEGALMYRAAG
jgi:hypothetical protein